MISVNWATGVISVPQSDLTPLGGDKYELDVNAFRLALKDLEDDEAGMPWLRTHDHNTETTLAGVTFARQVRILAPYTVTFEDGQYTVFAVGANHNISDVKNPNQVSLVTQNSAGLIVMGGIPTVGQVASAVWQYIVENGESAEWMLRCLVSEAIGNATAPTGAGAYAFLSLDGTKTRVAGTISSSARIVSTRDGDP